MLMGSRAPGLSVAAAAQDSPRATTVAAGSRQVTTQPFLTGPTDASIVLVLGVDAAATEGVAALLPEAEAVTRSVASRAPDGQLSCVVGIGSGLWDRLGTGSRPAKLRPFPVIAGATHTAVSTPGDLLFHLRARRMDLCFELAGALLRQLPSSVEVVDEVHGFKYFDERNLLGFVDGTENPNGAAAVTAAVIGDEDADFHGGSYVVVQKYLHDVVSWQALSVEDQERAVGRTKLENVELAEGVQPANSHVALNVINDDSGAQQQILRRNLSFGAVGEELFGTYFIGYAADPDVLERMLRNMFVGDPPGNHDRILDFSRAVTGTLFFVPSVEALALDQA
jgi:putative iron-dependent peroxidase